MDSVLMLTRFMKKENISKISQQLAMGIITRTIRKRQRQFLREDPNQELQKEKESP